MRRFLFVVCCCLIANPVVADEKVFEELWRAYGADEGGVEELLTLQREVDRKIVAAATESLLNVDLPVWGEAETVIIEFSDYQCGYCKRMFPLVEQAVEEGRAQVRVVEWPVLGRLSIQAARYALAARARGKYVEFHRRVMNMGRLNEESLAAAVAAVGLDKDDVNRLIEESDFDDVLRKNYQMASLLRLSGTPAFVINGVVVRGALPEEEFNRLLTAQ